MKPSTPITLAAAGYRTLDRAIEDHDAVWGARTQGAFQHSALAVLVQEQDGRFLVERDNSTARFLTWGDGLLAGALTVLLPRWSARTPPPVADDGRGAIIRHFHGRLDLADRVAAAALLDDSPFGLAVVVVNRRSAEVASLLLRAERVHAMDTAWGDLEEQLARELAPPRPCLYLVGG